MLTIEQRASLRKAAIQGLLDEIQDGQNIHEAALSNAWDTSYFTEALPDGLMVDELSAKSAQERDEIIATEIQLWLSKFEEMLSREI